MCFSYWYLQGVIKIDFWLYPFSSQLHHSVKYLPSHQITDMFLYLSSLPYTGSD